MACVQLGEPQVVLDQPQSWQGDAVHSANFTSVATNKVCKTLSYLKSGSSLHDQTRRLEESPYFGSCLVDTYFKWGCLTKKHNVFDELCSEKRSTLNVLIADYAEQKQSKEAFELLKRMEISGISPNVDTYISVLRACERTIFLGQQVHAEIARNKWLVEDLSVSTALIQMYARCGLLATAEELFRSLAVRDVASWNAIMVAYAQYDQSEKVLTCLRGMQSEGISPDAYSLSCSLKACGNTRAIYEGERLHAEVIKQCLLKGDVVLGNALVDMYAQCGVISKAQEIFENLLQRDVISWNSLMAGYVNLGLGEEALKCFEYMKQEGITPDEVSFLCSLKACSCAAFSHKGQQLHAEIVKEGLEGGLLICSKLIDMYGKCGLVVRAQEIFDMLKIRDVVSWNALISGYCIHKREEKALSCFKTMKQEGFIPNAATYLCLVKACCNLLDLDEGEKLHHDIARRGLLENNIAIGNAVVDMYCKCGSLTKAKEVFYKLPTRDIVSWNSLIAGLVQHGFSTEALDFVEQMQKAGVSMDATTYVSILKICGALKAVELGEEIRSKVVAKGLLNSDLHIRSSLVDMYIKCGLLAKALDIFDEQPAQDTISWNTLISGYVQYNRCEEALSCFGRMQHEGAVPDVVTYVCSLKACGTLGQKDEGRRIEAQIFKEGLWDCDQAVNNAVVDMYAKCGLLAKAGQVLDRCLVRDVYTWNALIVGLVNHEFGDEALVCLEKMKDDGIVPDEITHVYVVKACSSLGAIDKGEALYNGIPDIGSLGSSINLRVAMLDMYGKNGLILEAQKVFDTLPVKEIVAWNALMTGYALLGKSRQVYFILNELLRDSKQPNAVTYVSVLSSCSHAGLLCRGQFYFAFMKYKHGITPELEHYACMIDLLSRAGQLEEALLVASLMPFHCNQPVWHTLLSACRQCSSADLRILAVEHALNLDDKEFSGLAIAEYVDADVNILEDSIVRSYGTNYKCSGNVTYFPYLYAEDNG